MNAEPGCRRACVATSKGWREKSRPPTRAFTCPVCGSIATSAPAGPVRLSVVFSVWRAFFCIARSIVVYTFSPPPNVRARPKRAISSRSTYCVKYAATPRVAAGSRTLCPNGSSGFSMSSA